MALYFEPAMISNFLNNFFLARMEESSRKPSKFRLDESMNRMKTRVQLFYTYSH